MISVIYDGWGILCDEEKIGELQEHFRVCYLDETDEYRLFYFGDVDVKELRTSENEIICPTDEFGGLIKIKIEPRIGVYRHDKSGNRLRIVEMTDKDLIAVSERFNTWITNQARLVRKNMMNPWNT